jgi:predicted glutamine amidotransferase
MCRLYAFRGNEPTKIGCALISAQNALLRQSRADRRGDTHPDGWGIAFYADGMPEIERRSAAAYDDLHFSRTAELVYARTVIAHVRRATVGAVTPANTHPFAYGRWVFAHNGTVRGIEGTGEVLTEETPIALRQARRGSTDSELAFLWLLGRLARHGIDLDARSAPLAGVMEVVADSLVRLEMLARASADPTPAKLNFLLTNGDLVVGSRWRGDLQWVERLGDWRCELCGVPHIEHRPGIAYRAVVIASEPITREAWREVPDGSVIGLDGAIDPVIVRAASFADAPHGPC